MTLKKVHRQQWNKLAVFAFLMSAVIIASSKSCSIAYNYYVDLVTKAAAYDEIQEYLRGYTAVVK